MDTNRLTRRVGRGIAVLALVASFSGAAGAAHAAPAGTPIGNFDNATAVTGGAQVRGWAWDPSTTAPVVVSVTVTASTKLTANLYRPDVAKVYPKAGSYRGFDGFLPLAAGSHKVCVTALNVGAGANKSLGCRTVTVPAAATALPVLEPGIPMNGWTTKLAAGAALETDPALNGTANGGVPYAKRFANMAKYHSASSPVAGYYSFGYNTITSPGAAPVYVVRGSEHRTQKVTWMLNNGAGPEASLDAASGLQRAFLEVPVPTGPNGERFENYYGRSLEAAGSDKQLVIYKPETGEMWEMWLFRYSPERGRYEMGYGGYTRDVRTAPIALPNNWGARATSIPLAAGIMLQSEYVAGEFKHPLTVAIPVVKPGFIAPATREDAHITWHTVNHDGRDAVPEGAWFRLPADFPIDATKPKLWQMMVKAARDYGIVVADGTGGSMTFSMEAPQAVGTPYSSLSSSSVPVQTNHSDGPYWGANNVLNTFPWDALVQVAYRP